jgi:hypothetical protein
MIKQFFILLTMLVISIVYADTWALPTKWECFSKNKIYRLTVIPRDLNSQLAYFKDKCDDKEKKAGQLKDGKQKCTGILAKKASSGEYNTVWKITLVNDVSPTGAMVTDDGKYVITFNNWHQVGYGPDTVVIYSSSGKLIKQFALRDFLAEEEYNRLPRSVSSIWWGGKHRIDKENKTLILRVVKKGNIANHEENEYFPIYIQLAGGKVSRK